MGKILKPTIQKHQKFFEKNLYNDFVSKVIRLQTVIDNKTLKK